MAVYTHVSREDLDAFLKDYDLPPLIAHHGITAGVENSNYLLEMENARYILTLFEKRVDPADLPFYLNLMDHLRSRGVQAPWPITDHQGTSLKTLCDRPATIVSFLDGVSEKHANPVRARGAGALLARMHVAADGFSMRKPNNFGPECWINMVEDLGPRLNDIEDGLYSELSSLAEQLKQDWPTDLPKGAIHADYFPDNVMFAGDKPSGVIDFYFGCTDFFAYDLAIAMNAFTPENPHTPIDGESFLAGYESIRPLSDREKAALPLFLQGSALRFTLTRAHDVIHQVPGSIVVVKDPAPWLALVRAHGQKRGFFRELS